MIKPRNQVFFFPDFSEKQLSEMNSRSIFPASAANRNIDQGSSNSRLLPLLLQLQSFNEVSPTLSFILRKTILITFDILSRPFLYETREWIFQPCRDSQFSNLNVTIVRKRRRNSGNESESWKKELAEFFREENCTTKRICVHRDGRKKKLIEIVLSSR